MLGSTHPRSIMTVVYCPPSPNHLIVWRPITSRLTPLDKPGLVAADEVYHVDAGLKMSVCRDVLIVG